MVYTEIEFQLEDEIARIRLNRPEVLNATNLKMHQEIFDAVQQVNQNNIVRVLIISGNGRAFCTGGNMSRTTAQGAHPGTGLIEHIEHERTMAPEIEAIRTCRVPTIAQVHGYAVAWGFFLIVACDLAIAAEGTKIGTSAHTYTGPRGGDWVGLIPLKKLNEMVYMGKLIDAEEWLRAGLLNKIVPLDKLKEETLCMASEICKTNPLVARMSKESILLAREIQGLDASFKVNSLINSIGAYAIGFWDAEFSEKRAALGMDWYKIAAKAGAFRDSETRERVVEDSLKELNRQKCTFTDLGALEKVINKSIQAIRKDERWKGPKIR